MQLAPYIHADVRGNGGVVQQRARGVVTGNQTQRETNALGCWLQDGREAGREGNSGNNRASSIVMEAEEVVSSNRP